MSKNKFKPLVKKPIEFFEGFKAPSEYISFGDIDISNLNMDDFNSNLLILKKPVETQLITDIVEFFENRHSNEEIISFIAKSENDSHIMLMTFVDSRESNSLHHFVELDNIVQLLDDSTSTNDCLRALEQLSSLKKDNYLDNKEFEQMRELLTSQLSPKGLENIEKFSPELLKDSTTKTIKKKF